MSASLCVPYFGGQDAAWISYVVIAHSSMEVGTRHMMVNGILTLTLRELHPRQANRRPMMFMLEIAAALLSVLALRDGILGSSAMSLEASFAIGLWATLLAVACGLAIHEAWSGTTIHGGRNRHS
jgi:high-affinity K+ transport system ATPase subunit B